MMPNGLRVVAVPHRGMPQVALKLVVPAGSTTDPPHRPGVAALVGALLTEGTLRYDADELNARLDALGTAVSVQIGHDFAEIEILMLSETLLDALPLFGELVTRPTFPVRELERVRAETLDTLEAREDEPANVADDRAARAVFGSAHPYGRLALGSVAGVQSVLRRELMEQHRAHYRPGGSFLVVAGEFDGALLRDALDAAFAGWEGEAPPLASPPAPAAPVAAGQQLSVAWADAAQAEIRTASRGLERASPDWISAAVANYILGGSTITGRLGANLREKKGWTYGVRSSFAAAVQPGGWVVETAVAVEVAEQAIGEVLREIRRMCEEEVSPEELQRAKDALVLSLPRAFETPSRIVTRLGTIEAFGLPEDYWATFPERVDAVSAQDVLRATNAYFSPDQLVHVMVGSAAPSD